MRTHYPDLSHIFSADLQADLTGQSLIVNPVQKKTVSVVCRANMGKVQTKIVPLIRDIDTPFLNFFRIIFKILERSSFYEDTQ